MSSDYYKKNNERYKIYNGTTNCGCGGTMNHLTVCGYKIIPSPYITDGYKINYNLLQRLIKKHPNKRESDFLDPKVYFLTKEKVAYCSYKTYAILVTKGDFNGTSSDYFSNLVTDFINRMYRVASGEAPEYTPSPDGRC